MGYITFRQTVTIFLAMVCLYFVCAGVMTLHGCAMSPQATGGAIALAADAGVSFVDLLLRHNIITPEVGVALQSFVDHTQAAIEAAKAAAEAAHQQALAAQQSAGTAQLTAGGVGFAALASDQAHKVLAVRAAKAAAAKPAA